MSSRDSHRAQKAGKHDDSAVDCGSVETGVNRCDLFYSLPSSFMFHFSTSHQLFSVDCPLNRQISPHTTFPDLALHHQNVNSRAARANLLLIGTKLPSFLHVKMKLRKILKVIFVPFLCSEVSEDTQSHEQTSVQWQ